MEIFQVKASVFCNENASQGWVIVQMHSDKIREFISDYPEVLVRDNSIFGHAMIINKKVVLVVSKDCPANANIRSIEDFIKPGIPENFILVRKDTQLFTLLSAAVKYALSE